MLLSFVLLFALLNTKERVERYIHTVIVWTIICFGMTEVLSCFNGITTRNLWICWLTLDMFLLVGSVVKYRKKIQIQKTFSGFYKPLVQREVMILAVFAVVMLFLIIRTVPYNWDSMTYHLPRLYYWKKYGSVAHYATSIDRQVASPVLGAFVNLHVYVLCGGKDIFVNLLQGISFLTNGVLIYFIARKLLGSKNYCILATVLYYSTPIAFAEAFTTQVDNFSALWMLCFVYLIMEFLKIENKIVWSKECVVRVMALSACIAFGYLAKSSVCIGMVFFAFWLLIVVIKRKDSCGVIGVYLLLSCVVILMLLAPELVRNIITFGAISSPVAGKRQLIGSLYYKDIFVNCLKNITFNLPSIWIYNSTGIIWKYMIRLARFLGVNIDDPAISEDGKEFYVHDAQDYGHDTAVNPIIVSLLILCVIFFFIRNRKRTVIKAQLAEIKNQYFIFATVSFVIFCAVLRWEPFVSRYMISYFAVLCPAVAVQLELFFLHIKTDKWNIERYFMTILCFICAVEFWGLLYCHGEIAIKNNRPNGYFYNRPPVMEDYKAIADVVNQKSYESVGICIGGDTYEYPLLQLLEDNLQIEHVNVSNQTARYEKLNFYPDAIIVIDLDCSNTIMELRGVQYRLKEKIGEKACIYEK